jgi:predicted nucleic acid-binding protein
MKRKAITEADAVSVVEAYGQMSIRLLEVDITDAVKLASKHAIYAYDAYVLQCAIDVDGHLLTLDSRMLQVAKVVGIKTLEVD